MLVTFRTWFNVLWILFTLVVFVWGIRDDTILFLDKTTREASKFFANSFVALCFTSACSFLLYLMAVCLLQAFSNIPQPYFTSTYTNERIMPITSVRETNDTDYYLVKDNNNSIYTFAYIDNETGKTIEQEIYFDRTIVIPFTDCKQPSVIWTHNNHNYYYDFEGNLFANPQYREFTRDDISNYNDLVIFLIPANSVLEYTNEPRWV